MQYFFVHGTMNDDFVIEFDAENNGYITVFIKNNIAIIMCLLTFFYSSSSYYYYYFNYHILCQFRHS